MMKRQKRQYKEQLITKKEFEELLKKAAQPISEWQTEKSESRAEESYRDDGCPETRKNQDKTGDRED